MSDRISRRDFLNGMSIVIGAGVGAGCGKRSAPRSDRVSTFAQQMAGGNEATLADAHALRDGKKYSVEALAVEEEVDLLVVGAGISGLAAAYFYHQRRPTARILILDNQEDFGGHARRCEMHVDGRLILGYGGSESLQSPASLWSGRALALLADLGVDVKRFETYFDRDLYPGLGLSRGVLFTREAFGVDRLVTGDPTRTVADDIARDRLNARAPEAFVRDFPVPARSRARLTALYTERRDVLPGKTSAEKAALLAAISYREFLLRYWDVGEAGADVFQKRSHDFFAIGMDGVPALDAAKAGYPGFDGLQLWGPDETRSELEDPYIHHFPDGNASLARLLVRRLIPGVAPGTSMEDVVTARFDYGRFDRAGASVRLRLHSTAVVVRPDASRGVDVGYLRRGSLRRIRARDVIHGGYNMMLPYMTEALEPEQGRALRACVKAPLAYVKVAVRNWEPWVRMGVHEVTNPMGFFSRIKLDYPVSMGGYRCARSPREPIGLHLVHVPTPLVQGGDQRTAWRSGRGILMATRYEQFEQNVCDELTRLLAPGGFEAKRDIAAIHVYRWGHGYAYGVNTLYDAVKSAKLAAVAHRRVGRVAIANSDAGWSAYAHSAIDQAARAVEELESS